MAVFCVCMEHLCLTQTASAEHTSTGEVTSQSTLLIVHGSPVLNVDGICRAHFHRTYQVTLNNSYEMVANSPQIWTLRQQLSLQCQ